MFDADEGRRQLWSILKGASRGCAVSLGIILGVDVGVAGDAAGVLHIGAHHPSLLMLVIMTLLPIVGMLELERERRRMIDKHGLEDAR
jgi:hypothetical protein